MIFKPCPFCGSKEGEVIEGSTFRWRMVECAGCGAKGPEIRCQTLGTGTKEQWEENARVEAIEEWNRRTDENPQSKETPTV